MSEKVSRLAKMLASDELKTRKLGHKLVLKLLRVKPKSEESELTYENILGVCKGLHYSLWMQDKLLLQEDTVERIVKLLPLITSREIRVKFVAAMFETLAREWENLDIWRVDKFMMLARQFFVKALMCTKKRSLSVKAVTDAVFNKVLNSDPNAAIDLKVHLCTVIGQELPRNKDLPAVILSFYKHTLAVLLTVARANDYITCLTRLLLILARLVRANRAVRAELSEQALLLSTKHPLHRKTLCRISKMLHLKPKQKSTSPTDETADTTAPSSAPVEVAVVVEAKAAAKQDPSETSCDAPIGTTATTVQNKMKKNRKRKHPATTPNLNADAPAILSVDDVASPATSKPPTEVVTPQPTKPSCELLPGTLATDKKAAASTASALNGEKESAPMETTTPSPSAKRRNRKRRRSSSLTEPVDTDEQTPNGKSPAVPTPTKPDSTTQSPKSNRKNRKRRRSLPSVDLDASQEENKASLAVVVTNPPNAVQATSTANAVECACDVPKKTTIPVESLAAAEASSLLGSTGPPKPSLGSPRTKTTGEVNSSTTAMLADFDDSLSGTPVSAKKRVSFGKVFRKRFSANRSLTISPSLKAIPDRGILRQQSS